MKTNLLKALLLAVGVTASLGTWGSSTTTTYDFEDDKPIFTADSRISVAVESNTGLNSKVVAFTNAKNAANAYSFAHYDFSDLVKGASKVTVSFDYYNTKGGYGIVSLGDATTRGTTGGSSKQTYNGTGALFRIGSNKNYALINSSEILSQSTYCDQWLKVSVTVDNDYKTLSYTVKKNDGTVLTEETNAGYYNEANSCSQIDVFGYINSNKMVMIDNLSITSEIDESRKYVDYTIKYVDADGNEIKDSRTANGLVGLSVQVLSSDKEAIYNQDKSKKYVYDSDDSAAKTIGEEGNTVVTVKFKEAQKYTYAIKAVDESGNELKEIVSGSQFEGDDITAYYSKAFQQDGKWYMADQNKNEPYYGVKFTAAGTTKVTFKEASIEYFAEVEELDVSGSFAVIGGYIAGRYSNGKTGRLSKKSYAYTDAFTNGGKYTLYLWARNNSSSAVANIVVATKAADGTVTALSETFEDWTKGLSASKSLSGIVIPKGSSLVLQNSSDYNSNLELDYIYLVKEETSQQIAISAAGYATAVTSNNVSIPDGVSAYTVSVNDGATVATLNELKGTIPAGTAILVKGSEGSHEFPYSSDETAETSGNKLVAATTAVSATGTQYALSQIGGAVGFYQVKSGVEIPAGKAYLEVSPSTSAKTNFLTLDGETTGITSVSSDVNASGKVYNLQGQLVGRSLNEVKKGMYIVEGKKVFK